MTIIEAPASLPPATAMVALGGIGKVPVPCEAINEWLAITPTFIPGGLDGRSRFSGEFNITHLPSGYRLSDAGCMSCCRRAAREMAALDVDWSAVDPSNSKAWSAGLPDDVKRKLSMAHNVSYRCDAEYCEEGD